MVPGDDEAWRRGAGNTYGETLNAMDGLGDWNMSWDEWSKGNADANQ